MAHKIGMGLLGFFFLGGGILLEALGILWVLIFLPIWSSLSPSVELGVLPGISPHCSE